MDQHFVKSRTISTEIRWVNSSFNSGDLFSIIFPDSDIAKRIQCGRTKAGYVAHFVLAPYFHELMLSKLLGCPYVSLSFDESSSRLVQKGQMDIIIRFWDSETNSVATRYLGLEFMGRSTAEDVLQTVLSDLD